jgi:hypothetical protein
MFKTIPMFPNYEVDEHSNVRGKIRGIVLKQKIHDGYSSVGLCSGGKYAWRNVHRLCIMAWLGVPENHKSMDAAHNDGNRSNNHISNLRWATRKENCQDRDKHGTTRGFRSGDEHPNLKLSAKLVAYMRDRIRNGERFMNVVADVGAKKLTVYDAVTGVTWKTVNQISHPVALKTASLQATHASTGKPYAINPKQS